MTTDAQMLALAQRFFDSAEVGDIDIQMACYAPGAVIWHNTDGIEQSREENAAVIRNFVRRIRERKYTNRRVHLFPGGFLQMHDLEGLRADGVRLTLPACVVCQVRDGLIVRLDDFFDSVHVAEFRKEILQTN